MSRVDAVQTTAEDLAGRVTRELGLAWDAIRERHPDLPPAVLVLASGQDGKRRKWGHWGESRWSVSGESAGEVLIAGELLAPGGGNDPGRPVEERVLGTLLHEAAHALATARGTKDTSRGGRYHNAQYRELAHEVGLTCEQMKPYGWALTALAEGTAERYRWALARLRDVLTGHRASEGTGAAKAKAKQPRAAAVCGCGRKLQVARGVLAQGPITCGVCGEEFVAPGEDA